MDRVGNYFKTPSFAAKGIRIPGVRNINTIFKNSK